MTSVCRDEARGREAVAGLAREGLHPRYHALDITDEAAITRLRDHLREQHGGLDVLVNNAGLCLPSDTELAFGEQARVTLGLNYYSNKVMSSVYTVYSSPLLPSPPQRVCELLFPLLRRGGRVVNVSSGAGWPGFLRTGLPGLVPPGHAAHAEQIIAAVTAPDLSLAALEDMVRGYQQLADAGPDKVVALLPKIFSRLKNIC